MAEEIIPLADNDAKAAYRKRHADCARMRRQRMKADPVAAALLKERDRRENEIRKTRRSPDREAEIREYMAAYRVSYRERNAGKIKESGRIASAKYRANMTPEQRDRAKIYQANYDAANRERKNATWRKNYWARYRSKKAAWWKCNPDKKRTYLAKCRAIRRGASGRHSADDIKEILLGQRARCAACRISLKKGYHVDHILALARGGSNDRRNLQLLCPPCNRRKHARDATEFMQELGFLL